ncbi:hypothetical protein B0H14DRAFT_2603514 [Mycena olivaceomarginata]|nr:hypothetical protein B0H14DRAFT_2603514 [Mycena olivaceomarginata]
MREEIESGTRAWEYISMINLPTPIANDRRLKDAESAFSDALQTLRKERCLRGEEASIDELLNPQIEQEDLDSEFLRFAEGDEGTREILEYLKRRDNEEEDEEDSQEPEFKFSKRRPWMRSLSFKRLCIIGQIWMWLCHLLDILTNFALHSPRKWRKRRFRQVLHPS